MIAIYLRLSVADGDLGERKKDKSNSIENQRMFLRNYIMNQSDLEKEALKEHWKEKTERSVREPFETFYEVLEYVDDGYTGTNFQRPGFQKMLEECKKGRVTTILVKDLSRLGRNYIEVGDYVEQLFPMLGIRFIAVNDHYDSHGFLGASMEFNMEINNLISTLYSRDLSKKQKSSRQFKWSRGISTAGSAPYGYIKSKEKKGGWQVDEEAAAIVRWIFEKATEGYKAREIAALLNEKNVLTPGNYGKRKGLWKNQNSVKAVPSEQLWDGTKICKILSRYEYTGAFVAGRRISEAVGSHRSRKKDMSEWIILENIHEPIVSKETYEAAGHILRHRTSSPVTIPRDYPLKGKIRCGNCHLSLAYEDLSRIPGFHCRHGRSVGKYSRCCKASYPANHLELLAFQMIQKEYACACLFMNVKKRANSKEIFDLGEVAKGTATKVHLKKIMDANSLWAGRISYTDEADSALSALEREIALLRAEKMRQYEKYASGHMNKNTYLFQSQILTKKIEQLEQEKDQKKQQIKARRCLEQRKENREILPSSQESPGNKRLDAELVQTFLDVIYIYDETRLELTFCFEDILEEN
ncbi:MAG: recombinase family protein [Eubacteriales bacterium]|nr:recombinase family protein [Eubacteriales bacterium]